MTDTVTDRYISIADAIARWGLPQHTWITAIHDGELAAIGPLGRAGYQVRECDALDFVKKLADASGRGTA
jgi:hypothetical protein